MSHHEQVSVLGELDERFGEVLTDEALDLIADLHRKFEPRRRALLDARKTRYDALVAGGTFDFLPETAAVREGTWQVAAPAPGLEDRRCEITGPAERKMTINALNSGARCWMADFEDASTPTWHNVVQGQLNLMDALDGTIEASNPSGTRYALSAPIGELATILVRPRGWHLSEKHLAVDGERVSGGLVDFALYLVGCARRQLAIGKGPYFYLAKLEGHEEARLWNDVFTHAEDRLGLARGTIRATVLIETLPAAFEMDEILYELREHSSGLNAGRWDYIFSVIKKLRSRGSDYVLPDRSSVTMTVPFMRAYTELLVSTCHRRGAHAIGGMAAFIPSRDEAVNAAAFEKVTQDKARDAADGFDGSWVAHPGMVAVCTAAFSEVLGDRPNQLDVLREDVTVTASELLDVAATPGAITEAGLRSNVSVGIQYLHSWLAGNGAAGIFNLMEDAATAEISRSQIWQWLHNDVTLDTGQQVSTDLVRKIIEEEVAKLPGGADTYREATEIFVQVALSEDFTDFLTLPAYERLP